MQKTQILFIKKLSKLSQNFQQQIFRELKYSGVARKLRLGGGKIEGEARIQGAKRPRIEGEARIQGEARIEGEARDFSGGRGLGRGLGEPLPRKF